MQSTNSVIDLLSSPAFIAFIAFIVFGLSVYSGYKIRNKGQNVWTVALFSLVLQFVVGPMIIVLGSYFANVLMATAVIGYPLALLISSVAVGFFYVIKMSNIIL